MKHRFREPLYLPEQPRHGCHNRPSLQTGRLVQDGWHTVGVTRHPRIVHIFDPMTKTCQYTQSDLGQSDPGCTGCEWKK